MTSCCYTLCNDCMTGGQTVQTVEFECRCEGRSKMNIKCYDKLVKKCVDIIQNNCSTLNANEAEKALWGNKLDLVRKKNRILVSCGICHGFLNRRIECSRDELTLNFKKGKGRSQAAIEIQNKEIKRVPFVPRVPYERKECSEDDTDTLNRYMWKPSSGSNLSNVFDSLNDSPQDPAVDSAKSEDFPALSPSSTPVTNTPPKIMYDNSDRFFWKSVTNDCMESMQNDGWVACNRRGPDHIWMRKSRGNNDTPNSVQPTPMPTPVPTPIPTSAPTTSYSNIAGQHVKTIEEYTDEFDNFINRDPITVFEQFIEIESLTSFDRLPLKMEHHTEIASIMCFNNYDSTLHWKSRLVGKNGAHIQDIEDLYNVRISIRNRNNELHILSWGTDISARKDCFAHINTKIDKYNM